MNLTAAIAAPRRVSAALPSPLSGATAEAWTRLVRVLCRAPLGTVTTRGLGCFATHLRRLAEVQPQAVTRDVATARFLGDYVAQYAALCESVRRYAAEVAAGALGLAEGSTLSGTLAILHVAGRSGLREWDGARKRRLKATVVIYDAANGLF